MRRRISVRKEDRIWHLRCLGYTLDSIARITNVAPSAVAHTIYRVRRRPPIEHDPIRRGRRRGWLDDDQVASIRRRRQQGEPLAVIAKDYWMTPSAICTICSGRAYAKPAEDNFDRYPFSFANRLRTA